MFTGVNTTQGVLAQAARGEFYAIYKKGCSLSSCRLSGVMA